MKSRQLQLIRFTKKPWRPFACQSARREHSLRTAASSSQQQALQFPTGHPTVDYALKPQPSKKEQQP